MLELQSAQKCAFRKTNPDDCNPESFIPDAPLLLCGFPNQTTYDLGLQAVSEAFELARNALQVLEDDPDSFSFTRYFDTRTPGMLETVKTVFKALLGTNGTGTAELRTPGAEVELWYDRYSSTYNETDLICSSPTLSGVMRGITCGDIALDNSRAWITICSRAFEGRWRTLKEIKCQGLGDRASGDHLAPANIVLHELVHWGPLTEKYANFSIGDLGYGPEACHRLALDGESPEKNADNYNYFAVEAYFSKKCGIDFKDPVQSKRETDQALHCGGVLIEGV